VEGGSLVAAGRKTKSINKTFYNAATLSRTLQLPHLLCDPFPLAVALKNRLKVCSYNKFFTQLVYNFLIYTLSPIYQHRADQKKGGRGLGRKRKPSLWYQSEILL